MRLDLKESRVAVSPNFEKIYIYQSKHPDLSHFCCFSSNMNKGLANYLLKFHYMKHEKLPSHRHRCDDAASSVFVSS